MEFLRGVAMLNVGVDLAKRKSQIAVKDENGNLHSECKLPNRKENFVKFIKSLDEEVRVVCETGNKCFWLTDILQEMGVEVKVANAYKVKLIAEARIKTDKVDARILADLLRTNFIPEVYVPSQDIRIWREEIRSRSFLVGIRTQLYNRIHAILDRYAIEYEASQLHMKTAAAFIETLQLPEPITRSVKRYIEIIQELNERIKEFEKDLKEKIKLDEKANQVIKLLETIPGIGWLSATALYLEIADINRFVNIKKLWSYLGIIPGVHQSGDVHRGGRLTRQGNRLLRWIIVEDAWVAIRTDLYYKNLYQRHCSRIGKTRAILPVARALLASVYRVWKEKRSYEQIYRPTPPTFQNKKKVLMVKQ